MSQKHFQEIIVNGKREKKNYSRIYLLYLKNLWRMCWLENEHNLVPRALSTFQNVIKLSKTFGDFIPRDPALTRVFSRRAAILKIVEGKALGTRLIMSITYLFRFLKHH